MCSCICQCWAHRKTHGNGTLADKAGIEVAIPQCNWDVCQVNSRIVFRSSTWSPLGVNGCLWWSESCRKGWNQWWLSLPSVCCCLGDKRRPTNVKHKRWRPTKRARPELWFHCKHSKSWTHCYEDLHSEWERKLQVYIHTCSMFLTPEVRVRSWPENYRFSRGISDSQVYFLKNKYNSGANISRRTSRVYLHWLL